MIWFLILPFWIVGGVIAWLLLRDDWRVTFKGDMHAFPEYIIGFICLGGPLALIAAVGFRSRSRPYDQ